MGNRTGFCPTLITNRAGQPFMTREHVATFNGRHNCSKSKVLILLYLRQQQGKTSGLCVQELAGLSGVSYSYIKGQVTSWVKWDYLNSSMVLKRGRPCFAYKLAARGRRFLEQRVPNERLQSLYKEILDWQRSQNM